MKNLFDFLFIVAMIYALLALIFGWPPFNHIPW